VRPCSSRRTLIRRQRWCRLIPLVISGRGGSPPTSAKRRSVQQDRWSSYSKVKVLTVSALLSRQTNSSRHNDAKSQAASERSKANLSRDRGRTGDPVRVASKWGGWTLERAPLFRSVRWPFEMDSSVINLRCGGPARLPCKSESGRLAKLG